MANKDNKSNSTTTNKSDNKSNKVTDTKTTSAKPKKDALDKKNDKDKKDSKALSTKIEGTKDKTNTGTTNVVNSGISQLGNPYFVWITIEFFGGKDDISYILTQNNVFVSLEVTRYFEKSAATCTLNLMDSKGGYDLEKIILTKDRFRIQYGFSEGTVSELREYQIMSFVPSLDAGYSNISIAGVSISYEASQNSTSTKVYGTDEKDQIDDIRNKTYEELGGQGQLTPTNSSSENGSESSSESGGSSSENPSSLTPSKKSGSGVLTPHYGGSMLYPTIGPHEPFKPTSDGYDYTTKTNMDGSYLTQYGTTVMEISNPANRDIIPPGNSEIEDLSVLDGASQDIGRMTSVPNGHLVQNEGALVPPSDGSNNGGVKFKTHKYKGKLISDIAREVIEEAGWRVGKIEETRPVEDVAGFSKKFSRVGMRADDFLRYRLAPYAVSAHSGAGGYVVVMHEKVGVKGDGSLADTSTEITVDFVPLVVNAVKGPNKNSDDKVAKFFYDVRTPRGATVSKIISFKPNVTKQVSANGTNTDVTSSDDSGESVSQSSDVTNTTERLENNPSTSSGGSSVVSSGSSDSEVSAQLQVITDYAFPTVFKADLDVVGNPNIFVLDIVEVNYIMMNGDQHHSSGQYIVLGVTDRIEGGNFTTSLQLGRGTDAELYRSKTETMNSVAEGGEGCSDGGGYSYVAPTGGYKGLTVRKGDSIGGKIDLLVNYLVMNGVDPMGASYVVGSWVQESNLSPAVDKKTVAGYYRKWGQDGHPVGLNQWLWNRSYGFGKLGRRDNPLIQAGHSISEVHSLLYFSDKGAVDGGPGVGAKDAPAMNTNNILKQAWYFLQEAKNSRYFNREGGSGAQVWLGLNSKVKGSRYRLNDHKTIIGAISDITGFKTLREYGRREEYGDDIWRQVKAMGNVKVSGDATVVRTQGAGNCTGATSGGGSGGSIVTTAGGGGPTIQTHSNNTVQGPKPPVLVTLPASFNRRSFPLRLTSVRMVSPFGYRNISKGSHNHRGVDLSCNVGTPVLACASGVIKGTDFQAGGAGNYITIDHGGGVVTLYMHLSKFSSKVGQKVNVGDQIALSGNTGISGGPHLHFEMRINGKSYAPEALVRDIPGVTVTDDYSPLAKRKNDFHIVSKGGASPSNTRSVTPSAKGNSHITTQGERVSLEGRAAQAILSTSSGYAYTLHICRTNEVKYATGGVMILMGPNGRRLFGSKFIECQGPDSDHPSKPAHRGPQGVYKLRYHTKSYSPNTTGAPLPSIEFYPKKGENSWHRSGMLIHFGRSRGWSIGCILPVKNFIIGTENGRNPSYLSEGGKSASRKIFDQLMAVVAQIEGRYKNGQEFTKIGMVIHNLV